MENKEYTRHQLKALHLSEISDVKSIFITNNKGMYIYQISLDNYSVFDLNKGGRVKRLPEYISNFIKSFRFFVKQNKQS